MSDLQKQMEAVANALGAQVRAIADALNARMDAYDQSIIDNSKRFDDDLSSLAKKLDESFETLTKSIGDINTKELLDGFLEESKSMLEGIKVAYSAKVENDVKALSDGLEDLRESVSSLPAPENGKDALDIEIMPSIDEAKSYPRGSYAIHNGGLFKAYQKTQGMTGWECVVNGISNVEASFNDKDLAVTIGLSDGTETKAVKAIPYPEYKGVFVRGGVYKSGDSTTWDGSLWIACVDSPAGEPNKSNDWRLAVKRGKDGRGLYAIARDNGFKGTEKQLLEHVVKGEKPDNIVRL